MINFFITDDSVPYSNKLGASLSSHTGMVFASDVFLLIETDVNLILKL